MANLQLRVNLAPYTERIKRLLSLARSNSNAFCRRIIWFIYLGYAYIFFMFLLALLLLAGTVGLGFLLVKSLRGFFIFRILIYLAPVIVTVVFFVLSLFVNLLKIGFRLIWFRVSPPGGLTLARGMAPLLYRMIEEVRGKVGSVPVHEIVLIPHFNVGILQVPRLGLFGAYRNILSIGLPILQATSPEQFRAIVAHELGCRRSPSIARSCSSVLAMWRDSGVSLGILSDI